MSDTVPYAALLAKGEDRRQRILAAAQKLLARYGWHGVTLGQIAREAGVSAAGLLHHFASREALLQAALDARDDDDLEHADRGGDILEELAKVPGRFERAADLSGMYAVLLAENLHAEAPLHDRFLYRHRNAVETVAEGIRRGQRAGRYRSDIDPALKALEIVAFLNGMETSWLLDPTTPLMDTFQAYIASLGRQLLVAPDTP